jgi:class 3 adenylate cyclase/tetratricopeptide (TPR) repeat protein
VDIGVWLNRLGLKQYEPVFRDNDIDLAVLPKLTAEDLTALGVGSIGHRRKLLDAAATLHSGSEAGAPAKQAEPSTPVAEAEGERRPVIVLFADLVGFTQLSSKLDPEEVHALLGHFFAAVDAVVERHGGTIDKHIGDCVMAVFGAPLAHRDDAERAIRAAIEMHKEIRQVSDVASRALSVHVGVASGTVVASGTGSIGHWQYTVTGEAANLASRLTSLAGPGETLLSDAIHQQLGDRLDAEPAGDVTVKGIGQPIRTWRLRGLRDQDPASHPFVGRRAELTQVQTVLSSCREARRGFTVYIRGEAGIGKSRFVEEVRRTALAHGFSCLTGLIIDFGTGKGQDAIRSLVRGLLGIAFGSEPSEHSSAAEKAIAEGLVVPDRRVYLNDLLDLPQPPETRALYEAMDNTVRNRGKRETVAELIRGLAGQRLLLLILEDLHWAEPATLAHAAELAATVAECAAVLVLTSRIEGDPLDASWRGATRGAPMMTIDLGPLRPEDAAALAETFEAAGRFLTICVERAGGHPLFLEQLLRGAKEIGAGVLPGSVQSAVLARVDTLEPGDKQALQAASVLGQRFALEVLRHLIGSPIYTADSLIALYLVRPEGEDFLFGHALIQEGVYASLLHARRRDLHRRAAAWYAGRDPMLHAEHLDRAEDPTAPRAYLATAKAEAVSYHHDRALRLAKRGFELARERDDIWALSCLLGELLHDAGEVQPSMAAFERALEIATSDVERCQAWIGLAAGMRLADRYEEAFSALQKAEAAAREQNLVPELSRTHHLRGNLCFPLGDIDGCLREHRAALSFARQAGSLEFEARALGGLGDAEYARGRMSTAHDHFRRCVDLSHEHGLGRIEVANLSMVAHTQTYLNDFSAAMETSLTAVELAARIGHQRAEIIAHNAVINITRVTAEIQLARVHIDRGLTLARTLGARRFEALGLNDLAMILNTEGRRSEALQVLHRALEISRETGINFVGPFILGQIAATTDEPEESREALNEGEALLGKGAVGHNHLWFHRYAVEAALRACKWDDAERFCAALEDYTRPEPLPWADFFIKYGRSLSGHGRNPGAQSSIEVLSLRAEAERLNFGSVFATIDQFLATGLKT